ncbi:DoxX family protein [Hyalangium sp.]|uniref:DoxX family protein n=1 Tax=Hyalangium sp. TaxID=2028555 RepID=UPI003899D884
MNMNDTTAASSLSRPASQPSKGLHIALWVVQVLLALSFIGAGFMKLTVPLEELGKQMAWVTATPGPLVHFIGLAEIAGALGLILPAATRIKPFLTGLAGVGLATVMVLALGMHISRGEFPMIGGPVVLGALAAFVAWGRLKKAPIAPRT